MAEVMATTSKDAPSRQAKSLGNKALKIIRRKYHIKTSKNSGRRGGKK